jgi:hypothetical protein
MGNLQQRLILVLYNRSLYAELTADLLQRQCHMNVMQARATAQNACRLVQQIAPDVVLVDSLDAGFSPDAIISVLLEGNPSLQVICLEFDETHQSSCPSRVRYVNTKVELLAAFEECLSDKENAATWLTAEDTFYIEDQI